MAKSNIFYFIVLFSFLAIGWTKRTTLQYGNFGVKEKNKETQRKFAHEALNYHEYPTSVCHKTLIWLNNLFMGPIGRCKGQG